MSGVEGTEQGRELIVVGGYEGFHLVSKATIERASEAADRADRIASCDDFGELRRSGDAEQLAEHLGRWGVSIDDYVTAIERSVAVDADRSGAVIERLEAVAEVDFEGDDEVGAPGDDESLPDSDDDVEDVYSDVIARGMVDDVPGEILDRFDLLHHPMFRSEPIAFVPPEQLASVVEALTAAGCLVLEDDS